MRNELTVALANQRRELGAAHDATLDELKRVREAARDEIEQFSVKLDKMREALEHAVTTKHDARTCACVGCEDARSLARS